MGIETEYGITASASDGQRVMSPDEIARVLFRPIVSTYSSSNIFSPNASRLYLDVGSHPEIATAECDSLSQLIAYERAGDAMVNRMAVQAEEALADEGEKRAVYLFKNNVDSAGNSYGCHENYLIGRHVVLKDLGKALLPFMITRQLICGAGMIRPAKGEEPARFVLSQRADQVWEGVSSATTRSRPIINTRDEPHGDSKRFRRMHVIVGDSNMAEPTMAVKVGSTLLMLEMLEAGFEVPNLSVLEPIQHIRAIALDPTGRTQLPLEGGGSTTALAVQQELCTAAERWLEHREDTGTPTAELARVVDLWKRTLQAIETQDFSGVDREIDWVIKRSLLNRYRERLGGDWSHPKLAQIDLTYHDIRPGRGLYSVLEQRGMVKRWIDDAAIDAAVDTAPRTTRAKLRGEFLAVARELDAAVTVDWTRMKVNRPEPMTEEFSDPFVSEDPRLDGLLDYMRSHPGS
ncbi:MULTISPECIES: Pup--protein ligase [Corynebacterium]|uniref:Pup--protein ligase n=1 Tax=Corynebacterium TaxID=1716 RepID=UPI0008A19E8A|nr:MULTISPECIES: Pup--protein ligase [Corynebacterium]MDK6814097.1 Pup--protein ligase [Corynebacterium sp. UMB6689]OFP21427.1 Pup--protein ligase [Corynebacterium sp. HMSC066C02]OFQ34660.1 Pup--protein ligase [Corynebacterium sp. HMSC072D12]OFT65412.1 Pup--protein ligase [Corynebacterium sp. HMSC05D03]QQU94925.1 Pup--protein ligase [Corynebacterium aurimucosum]